MMGKRSLEHQTDSELIARVLTDDDLELFGVLVARHQSNVRNLLRMLTRGDDVLADDLAQTTFIKAFRSIRSFRQASSFATWLYRIAYNLYLSYRRSASQEVPFDDEIHDQLCPATTGNVLLRLDLADALNRLKTRERIVIELCYGLGLTHKEAAESLDWPIGTVKTILATAKQNLQRELVERRGKVQYERH